MTTKQADAEVQADIDEPCQPIPARYTWKGKPITGAGVAKHLADAEAEWGYDTRPPWADSGATLAG